MTSPWRRTAAIALIAGAALWGLRLTILEGFVYEWPRAFSGDFAAAMYEARWWDGTGIMYGPVFVMERWLVNAWPGLFTVYTFALTNIPLVALSFGLSASAAGLDRPAALAALAAWLCFRALHAAFAVAANPEIVELALLSAAWFAAARFRPALGWTAVAMAALTKVIPAIFVPLLFFRWSRRGIASGAAATLLILLVVGIGQRLGPRDVVRGVLVPTQNLPGGSKPQIEHIEPVPSASTLVGLNTALARAAGLRDGAPQLARIQAIATGATLFIYGVAVLAAWAILHGDHEIPATSRYALAYGLFFSLMPLMTFHTHPHTFVFLLPAWTAIVAVVGTDPNRRRAAALGMVCAGSYVLAGLPAAALPVDRLLGTRFVQSPIFADPIWGNLGVIAALVAYIAAVTARRVGRMADG